MPWRIDPARVVSEAAGELADLFGESLRTLVVYGSAAGQDFDPTRSDVNLAVVATRVEPAHLGRVAQWWQVWRRQRVASPLVLSSTDLERSLDVFPLEFLDIQARHRTLAGTELFDGLRFAHDDVRAECEREAKGKLVRLRALYVELAGSTRELRALMVDSRKTFLHVIRGLLYVRGEPWGGDPATAVAAFERHFGCSLPVLASLRAGDAAIERHFAAYLGEVERIAVVADREAETR